MVPNDSLDYIHYHNVKPLLKNMYRGRSGHENSKMLPMRTNCHTNLTILCWGLINKYIAFIHHVTLPYYISTSISQKLLSRFEIECDGAPKIRPSPSNEQIDVPIMMVMTMVTTLDPGSVHSQCSGLIQLQQVSTIYGFQYMESLHPITAVYFGYLCTQKPTYVAASSQQQHIKKVRNLLHRDWKEDVCGTLTPCKLVCVPQVLVLQVCNEF